MSDNPKSPLSPTFNMNFAEQAPTHNLSVESAAPQAGTAPIFGFTPFSVTAPSTGYTPTPDENRDDLITSFLTAHKISIDKSLTTKLNAIYRFVGQLSSKVSEIELGWYLAFTCLMTQTPQAIAVALINTQRNAEGQRQMIMAVAAALFPEGSEFRAFFGQLKAATDMLMGRRNDAIHSVIHAHPAELKITATGPTKPSRLANKEIETELKDCIQEADRILNAIRHFLDKVNTCGFAAPEPRLPQPRAGWKNPLSDNTAK